MKSAGHIFTDASNQWFQFSLVLWHWWPVYKKLHSTH